MSEFAQGHALVIGVGDYQDARWRAPITVKDAEGMVDALTAPSVSGYPDRQVLRMYNERATRQGVIEGLRRLARDAQQDSTVIIFFAGHGALGDDGSYYFATQDTVFTPDQKIQAGTGLSSAELLDLLRAIQAQKLLFIINACFSGHLQDFASLGAQASLGAPPSSSFNAAVLATGEGRAIISASRPSQFSYYKQTADYTYFGQALIDGLRGQDVANSDGYIGLYELYQKIYRQVTATVAGIGGAQEPVLTILQNVGPFPVAHYPGTTPSGLGAPSMQQAPPQGMAVEVVERAIVQAIGQGALAINTGAGSTVNVSQGGGLINFGAGNRMGNIQIGDVASGDIIKTTITVTGAAAAAVENKPALLDLIGKVRDDVARLSGVTKGKREDAEDDLRKARDAGAEQDHERMVEKLESAQKLLMAMGISNPDALKVSETVGALLQRARAL
jgi:hypothetical protein